MSTLTKADLALLLHHQTLLSKTEAVAFVDAFFEEIRLVLASGKHLKFSGFGNFILRDKPERPGRNPKTKEAVSIAARRVVTFKPGVKLKAQMKANAL